MSYKNAFSSVWEWKEDPDLYSDFMPLLKNLKRMLGRTHWGINFEQTMEFNQIKMTKSIRFFPEEES